MDHENTTDQILLSDKKPWSEEIYTEQVRQIYALAPIGIMATVMNSLIIFFIMKDVMSGKFLIAWLTAIMLVAIPRVVLALKFRRVEFDPAASRTWKIRFLVGLAASGIVWGSIGFFPFSGISFAHLVFLAFVLGGMAAGAAATFSALKEGYPAYSIPALTPLAIRFFLIGDAFHYAMGGMLSLFGFLLWRVSLHNYRVNRTSLLLRFEHREMVDSLKAAKGQLLDEIAAKLKAEADLRAYHDQLEKVIEERTADLVRTNEQLVNEISERKRLEEEIMHMAHHDILTGMPNRRLFMDIINVELAQARRNRKKLALLFLDLDRFKEVNDTFGHEAGDGLLKEVSKRLKTGIRESDSAARIGGDEFNIILSDVNQPEDIVVAVRKIMDSLKTPFKIAGYELYVTASVGITIYPDDSTETDTLFRYADIAMYHAKESGRNTFQFYNPEINIRSFERIRFESYLRQAVNRRQLVVYYQPQIDIKTKSIVCAEALVRWQHPELGFLEPKRFIPMAEETDFIIAIDDWVLRTACEQVRRWINAGLLPVCVTVNLSARQFQSPDLVNKVARILNETGISPAYLDLEITESMAMKDISQTAARFKELTDMGLNISIDDFGTGFSSLNYLKRLPIQKLKIDQSFIRDSATDPDDRAIIIAVTAMAHSMRMRVIAEGVETEDQLSFLRESGCDEAQGYLLSRPLPEADFMELIAEGQ